MTIENPISTIKKAVRGSAEHLAMNRNAKKVKPEHYKEVFNFFRELKESNPEKLEKLIILLAEDKELKDELGPDLDSIFQIVWIEVNSRYAYKISTVIKQLKEEKEPDSEESNQKFVNSINEILNEMAIEIKKDPLVTHSFISKNEKNLLDKAITRTKKSIFELIKL